MRHLTAAVIALLLLPPAVLVAEEDPAKHYDAARKAEEARDFKAATEAYDKVLEIDEEYEDAFERWDACIMLSEWQEELEGEPKASPPNGARVAMRVRRLELPHLAGGVASEVTRLEVGRRRGEPEPRPMRVWKSEGRVVVMTPGKGGNPTRPSEGGPCW